MHALMGQMDGIYAMWSAWGTNALAIAGVLLGFSIIIFFHELGHFLAAKWVGVRVHRFAVGFGKRLFGYRSGEGFTFGTRPDYSVEELVERKYGETDYCMNLLPIGGYVKMLGQDDVFIDEQDNVKFTDDPRAFNNRPVGQRMIVVCAGVLFNVLFAAVLLICVFLLGTKMLPAEVGALNPDSPARGHLVEGDRIEMLNGERIDSFQDIMSFMFLLDEEKPVAVQFRRRGESESRHAEITPVRDTRNDFVQFGIGPVGTTKFATGGVPVGDMECPIKGDVVTHANGEAVESVYQLDQIFARSAGQIVKLTVERADESAPSKSRTVECFQRAALSVFPADLNIEGDANAIDQSHILGMQRRRWVTRLVKGMPAEKAGIKDFDVISSYAGILNPLFAEIRAANAANVGNEISVCVERRGQPLEFRVKPQRAFKLFGEAAPAQIGLEFARGGEEDKPIVAGVVAGTPAASVGMPRGSLLLSVDGKAVENWFDVVSCLTAAAGREIEIRFSTGAVEAAGRMRVPSSLVNELGIPLGARIYRVNDEKTVKTKLSDGRTREISLDEQPVALRQLLSNYIGKTVTLHFSRTRTGAPETLAFGVREDNFDPWQLRIRYSLDRERLEPKLETVSANGNPLRALGMGIKNVKQLTQSVYLSLTKLATRRGGADQVAGPVGIVSIGMEQVKSGVSDFMLFLAILSINLAVINFLPMPVMDGGLMVFLLIEKIKGSPLSFKVQMYTTLIGLAAIVLIGLVVTIQDIGRML